MAVEDSCYQCEKRKGYKLKAKLGLLMEEQLDQFRPYSFCQIDLKGPYKVNGKQIHALVTCCVQTKL